VGKEEEEEEEEKKNKKTVTATQDGKWKRTYERKALIYHLHILWSVSVKAAGGVTFTSHLRLVPRLRMRGAITPLPHTFSLRGA
jgi:hypothetical protein